MVSASHSGRADEPPASTTHLFASFVSRKRRRKSALHISRDVQVFVQNHTVARGKTAEWAQFIFYQHVFTSAAAGKKKAEPLPLDEIWGDSLLVMVLASTQGLSIRRTRPPGVAQWRIESTAGSD